MKTIITMNLCWYVVWFLLRAQIWNVRASFSTSSSVRIGGFFAPLSSTNHLFKDQAEHLAAFVMAVNDINDKTDGIYDEVLLNTKIEIVIGAVNSISSAASEAVAMAAAFSGQKVIAAVSSLHNEDALIVSQLLATARTVIAVTLANSGEFNDISTYPYTVNIRPIVSRQGMVLQNMICLSTVRKVVVIAATDADNMQMMSEFQDESICELDILAVISVRSELSDFSYEIEQAIPTGSRYFVLLLPVQQNAWFIEQGYAAGLFHDNTVLYTTINGATNITQLFSPDTDVARVLTGFFFSKFYPNYYEGRTDMANDFARRWRRQLSRAGSIVNGVEVCDASTDDAGSYLYQVVSNQTSICTGLDFSGYSLSNSNIHSYAAFTYDATILIAKAIDVAINNGMDHNDPKIIYDIMVRNISFSGASGPLRLFKGYSEYAYHGEGNRDAGTKYSINNFHPSLYSSGGDSFMVKVGVFDGHNRTYEACTPVDDATCFQPTYSAMTDGSYNVPPSDTPPVIIQNIPGAFSALCFAMTAVIVALVVTFGLFTLVNFRSKVVKASQPLLLCCILVGGLIAAARIAVGGLPKDATVCSAEIWLGHLALIVMIGSLFVKAYRVNVIVNTKVLARVTFSAVRAFRMLVGIVVLMLVYLTVMHIVGRSHMQYRADVVANQETDIRFCDLKYYQFQTALFVMEGAFLAISFRVCWAIRDVPDIVNESKQISTAMSVIVLVSVLILPIVYFLNLPPETRELVASFGFGFGSIVTLLLLFVPKVMVHYHLNSPKKSAQVATEGMFSGNYRTGSADAAAATDDVEALELLKGKSNEEKLSICTDHLIRWQNVLLTQPLAKEEKMCLCTENLNRWQAALLVQRRSAIDDTSSGNEAAAGLIPVARQPSIERTDMKEEQPCGQRTIGSTSDISASKMVASSGEMLFSVRRSSRDQGDELEIQDM
jgi:ABC-type branched-subunit amino acid transport system substrate-binding protein